MAASTRRLALGFGLPAELGEEAAMQIAASVMVCVGLVVTLRAPEQLAALPLYPFPRHKREPLAFGSASATVLTGPPGVDLDRDSPLCVGFVFGVLVDLAAKLVGLPAVHTLGLACAALLDLAQTFKKQNAARVASTDGDNARCHLMGGLFVHASNMLPYLLIAVFPFDRLS